MSTREHSLVREELDECGLLDPRVRRRDFGEGITTMVSSGKRGRRRRGGRHGGAGFRTGEDNDCSEVQAIHIFLERAPALFLSPGILLARRCRPQTG
jgi:hypothetical protein